MRAIFLVAILAAGCGGGGVGPLTLSWQFVDGRHCPDTGAATIVVNADTVLGTFACTAGDAPASVTIDNAPRSGSLRVQALSPQMNELYRGDLPLDAAGLPSTVTLYVTGSR